MELYANSLHHLEHKREIHCAENQQWSTGLLQRELCTFCCGIDDSVHFCLVPSRTIFLCQNAVVSNVHFEEYHEVGLTHFWPMNLTDGVIV